MSVDFLFRQCKRRSPIARTICTQPAQWSAPQDSIHVLQMPILGKGHEDIRDRQQENRVHEICPLCDDYDHYRPG